MAQARLRVMDSAAILFPFFSFLTADFRIKVIEQLLSGNPLPEKNKDHPLKGSWKERRDCHIEPDWILIYKRSEDELLLYRIKKGLSDNFSAPLVALLFAVAVIFSVDG